MKSKAILMMVWALFLLGPQPVPAQILQKMKARLEKKIEDKVTQSPSKPHSEKEAPPAGAPKDAAETEVAAMPDAAVVNRATSYKSKFDFVPGDQLLLWEDFEQDAIGDFPALWFTNGSGEVVTIEGAEGRWLMLKDNSRYFIDQLLELPDNHTIQFDLMCSIPFEWSGSMLYVTLEDIIDLNRYRAGRNGARCRTATSGTGILK